MDAKTNGGTGDTREHPWVLLSSAIYQTFVFKRMVRQASPDATPGDCVSVYDRRGDLFGHALYNPKSQIALRMLNFDATPIDQEFWQSAIERAVALRNQTLRLPDTSDAYRLVYSEGDDLSGLIVDRYGDILSIEVFSLGIWRQMEQLLPILHAAAGTTHHLVQVDQKVQTLEGFRAQPVRSPDLPSRVRITENGVRFEVQFDTGHKTGFFCDQRDNRRHLAELTAGADVLDVCSYTGGFGIYAKTLGKAEDVTCIDLDEDAIAMAKRNANLNQVRVDAVHADAFPYMRQMDTNGRRYGAVVLDPPKLIFGRDDGDLGAHKYSDLNRLAAKLVAPGGILLTCSCSGALGRDEFIELVLSAVRYAGRRCQVLNASGAAADHPISPQCPETAYLKALWLRIL